MKYPWFRVYTELRTDSKMEFLDDHQFRIWMNLLCMAAESKTRGMVIASDGKPYPISVLSKALRTVDRKLKAALALFERLDMVEITDDGIAIKHFLDRQYDKPSDMPNRTAERKQKSRQNKEESHANVTPLSRESHEEKHGESRESHANVTTHNTDTDTDIYITTTTTTNTNVSVGVDGSCCLDKIVNLYQDNISPLTGILAESLMADREQYGDAWVEQAIIMAVKQNKRKPAYVNGILQNWWRNGFKQDDKPWEVRGKPRGGTVADGKPKGEPPLKAFYRKFMDEESKEVQGNGQRA